MSKTKAVDGASGKPASVPDERRQKERFPCTGFAEVVLEDVAFLFRGSIRDLSVTGCYIQSSARLTLERGTQVDLRFLVRNVELRLSAKIMIVRPGAGAGFEFLPMGAEMRSRLASLIQKLANPNPNEGRLPRGERAEIDADSTSSRELWH
jgi:hypothetical protein